MTTGRALGNYIHCGFTVNACFINKTSLAQPVTVAFITSDQWAAAKSVGQIAIANANHFQGSLSLRQEKQASQKIRVGFGAQHGGMCKSGLKSTLSSENHRGALKTSQMLKQNAGVGGQIVLECLKAHTLPIGTAKTEFAVRFDLTLIIN